MLRRFPLILACAFVVASASSCDILNTSASGGTPVMIVSLNARTKGATFTTDPVTNFYNVGSANFTSAAAASDTCRAGGYDPNAVPAPITATPIGGGAYVAVQIGARPDTLRKVSTTNLTYRVASTSGITFTPGDSITFVVPGDAAGFPGATFAARTAEQFTFSPIIVPPSGQVMTLSWSAPLDPNSAMIVSLRYNNGTGTGLNAQVFCDFKDDGTGTVQAALAALWAASSTREVGIQRLRTGLIQVGGNNTAYFNMVSTYDLPTPVSP